MCVRPLSRCFLTLTCEPLGASDAEMRKYAARLDEDSRAAMGLWAGLCRGNIRPLAVCWRPGGGKSPGKRRWAVGPVDAPPGLGGSRAADDHLRAPWRRGDANVNAFCPRAVCLCRTCSELEPLLLNHPHTRARGQRLREAQLTLTSRGRCKQNPFVAGVPDLLALVEQMCGSFSI